jgi:hypothetical protein
MAADRAQNLTAAGQSEQITAMISAAVASNRLVVADQGHR